MTETSANDFQEPLERFGFSDIGAVVSEAKTGSPQEILQWAFERFGDRLVLANSLGPEDVVLVDMLAELGLASDIRAFTLDTGRLHQETYALMERLRERYGLRIELYFPDASKVEALVRAKGPSSFYESIDARRECCNIRKVEPLKRALGTASAWITGIRREQSPTRAQTDPVELDLANGGLIKVNPLVEWTRTQLWEHIRDRDIPYNTLHDQGFPSIGCAPCTRAVKPGEDERAGRWWWEQPDQKECGLHPAEKEK
jgi:phosphoadenosine phosphosulfate reductase